MNVDRIRTDYDVEAMVAPDSLPLIVERVRHLFSHDRRFAVAHSFATYTGRPPELYPSLAVDRIRNDGDGIWIACGDFGFGINFDHSRGDRTEDDVWRRYRAGKHEGDRDVRRYDMTYVCMVGGQDGAGPGGDDRVEVRAYNGDGICAETVIAFEQVAR